MFNVWIILSIEIETILATLRDGNIDGCDMLNNLRSIYDFIQVNGFRVVTIARAVPAKIYPALDRSQLVETPRVGIVILFVSGRQIFAVNLLGY